MKLSVIIKVSLGFAALALGLVGVVIPVFPTTPFVLLAIGCFGSTPRLQQWLLRIRFFHEYYDSYTKGSGLARRTVMRSLVLLWGMLTLSAVLTHNMAVIAVLTVVGIAVTIHILCIAKPKPQPDGI